MLLELALIAAMQDSTTTCTTNYGQTTCETRDHSQMSAYDRARTRRLAEGRESAEGLGALMQGMREADEAEADRQRQQAARNNLRHRVTAYLQAGNCPGAINIALDAGDIELATQARAYCAATPVAPQ